jgi:HTH-type transcriptional regulator/antitoxin HigA
LKKVEVDALKSQIADIEAEIAEYEMLKSGQITFSKSYALEALPGVLVQARIAAGLTQTDLGEKLGLKPQQIQRYEATNYMGASLARLVEVSRVLGVKYSGTFEGGKPAAGSVFIWNDVNDIVWSQLPYREMIKRGWFEVPRGANPLESVKNYFLSAAGPQFATAYHRKKMRSGNVPNEYALIAWQARVLERARKQQKHQRLPEFELDDRWVSELVGLTKQDDGPRQARQLLAHHGIVLIIESQLPGSYLDGAAMLSDAERPVIALTLRYDRLDNFWFVLFHELGHVFLHLFDGLRYDFFDEESAADDDSLEAEADKFALDTLIPEALWGQSLSRFALSEEAVRMDAERLGIAESIVAGRIRKERGNYTILNTLVGRGRLRSQFAEAST